MFERFSDAARRVVVGAQEQARLLNHNYIGTEHLLLGILAEPESGAARSIVAGGVDLDAARASVMKIIGTGATSPEGHIPFTPRAKKVLELSLREALQLKHKTIQPEHLLLGLLREGEGVAAQVLFTSGIDLAKLRAAVISGLSHAGRDDAPEPSRPFATSVRKVSAARCSTCDSPFDALIGLVRTRAISEDGETREVVLVVCATCGSTVGVLPA